MGRARRAIEALAELAPDTATVHRDGRPVEIPVESLLLGDIVVVRPNARLPADGFVFAGVSSFDQAPVAAERIPVNKQPIGDVLAARARPEAIDTASRVFVGTINGSGAIEIEVTRRAADSTLARAVKMVSAVQTRRSSTQRFSDDFERIYVPAVSVLTSVLLFAWVVIDEPFRVSFYRAMAALMAASPCALAIATPSAVLSGMARAARSGVLIKGGAPLKVLGSLRAMRWHSTRPARSPRDDPGVTDVIPFNRVSEQALLAVAVHEGSTLLAVANALRLLACRDGRR